MKSKKLVSKALALVLVLVLSVGLLPIQASAATITFTDVPTGAWYYTDVHTLANKGVVSGVGNNKFNPESNVAYCEMIKMVVNAFYRDNYDAYETYGDNYDTMRNYFGNQTYWYSFMAYYAKHHVNLLDGIDIDIKSYTDAYRPMSRYDMAQLLANTVKTEGLEPTEAQKAAAQKNILDYASIPAKYQDAVKTCFALWTKNGKGELTTLLNGKNGYFAGSDNMTRAEACAVIIRMENLIINGGSFDAPSTDPNPGTTPEPSQPVVPSSGIKDIKGNQFETAINALYAGGIITDADLTNGNFRPNDSLTFGEYALMYIRAFKGLTMAKKSDYPVYTFNSVDYLYLLDTPAGIADITLASKYYTGYTGGPESIANNETMDVKLMHTHVYNIVKYVTNTAPNAKWQPSWHGYGNPTTKHYGECGAFDTNLDQTRMNTTSWNLALTRGEWCQIMYNLGITQTGILTTTVKTGGVMG